MASTPKFLPLLFLVLFCFLLIQQQASECKCGYGCFYVKAAAQEIDNRKVLYRRTLINVHGSANMNGYGTTESLEGWELRKVPSGPDPLHHNGGSPKKPRTP